MSTGATTTPVPKQPGYIIRAAEIFAAGTHRGEQYTIADLDAMARNFSAARGVVDPPLVVGHEEKQPLAEDADNAGLDNTGIPAMGWITKVWRVGTKLFADFANVPASIAQAIRNRSYRKVSAEVYDEPPAGSPLTCKGKMLRRVALLGGELPQIKSLADLPGPEQYSERAHVDLHANNQIRQTTSVQGWSLGKQAGSTRMKDKRGSYLRLFSEATPMDRDAMVQALLAAGWAQENIDKIKDDETLGVVLSHEMAKAAGTPAPAEPAPEVSDNADMPTPETMVADLVAMGMNADELTAMTPDDLMKLWQEKKGTPMAATQPSQTVTRPAPQQTNRGIPGVPAGTPSKVTLQFSEIERRQKAINADLAKAEQLSKKRLAEEKLATVKAFCERQVKAGKMLPAEIETGVVDFACGLDAVTLHKFSDGKQATQLDVWMAQIEARPNLVKFGERITQPKNATADDEVAKVKRFSESGAMDSALAARNRTPADVVADFKRVKEKNPNLTAAQFLGKSAAELAA